MLYQSSNEKIKAIRNGTLNIEEFWKPFEVEIPDFDKLLSVINQIMEKAVTKNIKFAWRGQIDASWSLHSSLYRRMNLTKGRVLTEDDIANEERQILTELHRWGSTHPRKLEGFRY